VDAGYYRSNSALKLAGYVAGGAYYALPWNWTRATRRGESCYAAQTKDEIAAKLYFAQTVWNLPERPLISQFYALGLKRIKTDRVFYVPPSPYSYAGGADVVKCRIIHNRRARVERVYRSRTLARRSQLYMGPGPEAAGTIEALKASSPSTPLIVHFHGGGFISMSSFSHENYSRVWARQTKCPVISVDYRLAPKHPFPVPFHDSYRAYKFVVEEAHRFFGFYPSRIVVAGDSAGGKLAAAICGAARSDGYRVPDGCFLAYPAVDARRAFAPSLLWTLNDRILPLIFIEACIQAFLGTDPQTVAKTANDPRCSPACADDAVLGRFPPTRVVVGDRDPLYDQGVKFVHRLAALGVDASCRTYPALCHGFLSFAWPIVGVKTVYECIDDSCDLLKDLLFSQTKSVSVRNT
jgi:acetyl esterase/lipase